MLNAAKKLADINKAIIAAAKAAANPTAAPSSAPLTIGASSLAPATVGKAYSVSFEVGGGAPNYTYSLTGGALPAGLVLDTSAGAIKGTPTTAGSSDLEIKVTDSTGTSASKKFQLKVNP